MTRLANALDAVESLLARYVVFPSDHAVVATALWVAHTHAVDAAETTPYLAIVSAEKQSGKTRLLDVLELVVHRPWRPIEPSDAVVYSMIEQRHPTLLLDEVDALFGSRLAAAQHEALRGILNASNRRGARVARVEMNGRERRLAEFDAFGAKGFAGIRALPETLRDRSIVLELRRRAPSEVIERFRRRDVAPEAARIRAELVEAIGEVELASLRPDIPAGLDDRAVDGWEPLLAIADAARGEWPIKARRGAMALSGARAADDPSRGVRLLSDIRDIFQGIPEERIPSAELVRQLSAREDSDWGDLRGHALTAQGLARLLKPYGIHPNLWRISGEPERGYARSDFEDAWSRYLDPLPADEMGDRYFVTDDRATRNDVTRDAHRAPSATGDGPKPWASDAAPNGAEEQTTWMA